jgi:hypothetical protein
LIDYTNKFTDSEEKGRLWLDKKKGRLWRDKVKDRLWLDP